MLKSVFSFFSHIGRVRLFLSQADKEKLQHASPTDLCHCNTLLSGLSKLSNYSSYWMYNYSDKKQIEKADDSNLENLINHYFSVKCIFKTVFESDWEAVPHRMWPTRLGKVPAGPLRSSDLNLLFVPEIRTERHREADFVNYAPKPRNCLKTELSNYWQIKTPFLAGLPSKLFFTDHNYYS